MRPPLPDRHAGRPGGRRAGLPRAGRAAVEHLRRRGGRRHHELADRRGGWPRGPWSDRCRAVGPHRHVHRPPGSRDPALGGGAAPRRAADELTRHVELQQPAHRRPLGSREVLQRRLRVDLRRPGLRRHDPRGRIRRPPGGHDRPRNPRAAVRRRRTARLRRRHRLDGRADRGDPTPVARGDHGQRPRPGGRAPSLSARRSCWPATPRGPTTPSSAIPRAPSSPPVSSTHRAAERPRAWRSYS